jgi:hypothetical protein
VSWVFIVLELLPDQSRYTKWKFKHSFINDIYIF